MTSGSISDPNKGYHMEVVCENEGRAQFIQEIINGFGVEARIIQRKKYYVVYLKDGEMIVDMLGIMGAHISLMNMENIGSGRISVTISTAGSTVRPQTSTRP